MLLAVFGAVEGNFDAYQAVIRAIEDEGIHTIACSGNLVTGYAHGNDVIAHIRQQPMHCVQGTPDRLLTRFVRKAPQLKKRLSPELYQQLEETHDRLTSTSREFLHRLPRKVAFILDNIAVFLCYGAPSSPNTILLPETPLHRFQREREITNAKLIISGGAPEGFSKRVGDSLFIEPPPITVDKHTAVYGVVDTENEPWTFTLHAVSY